jgi:ABC-type dipeptide/oligopeptide/nickel transport system permease component
MKQTLALLAVTLPVVWLVESLQFGALPAGAIVMETIFSWPGLGRLTVSATSNRDYARVQGCLLSIGLTYLLANFFAGVVYGR